MDQVVWDVPSDVPSALRYTKLSGDVPSALRFSKWCTKCFEQYQVAWRFTKWSEMHHMMYQMVWTVPSCLEMYQVVWDIPIHVPSTLSSTKWLGGVQKKHEGSDVPTGCTKRYAKRSEAVPNDLVLYKVAWYVLNNLVVSSDIPSHLICTKWWRDVRSSLRCTKSCTKCSQMYHVFWRCNKWPDIYQSMYQELWAVPRAWW